MIDFKLKPFYEAELKLQLSHFPFSSANYIQSEVKEYASGGGEQLDDDVRAV